MKIKIGDRVKPTKKLWAKFLQFEKKSGEDEPPVHTVIEVCEDDKFICETPGYNYHLISEDNLEIVK